MEMSLALYPCNIEIFLKKCLKLLLTHQTRLLQVFIMLLQRIKELEQLLTQNESTIKLTQNEVVPLTKFVNMNKTRFTRARAFPTIFQPQYIDCKWTIRYDITGSITIRERNVNQNNWMEHLMWRSDGLPTSHPTFPLVLYNHKVRNQLQKLGSICLNT